MRIGLWGFLGVALLAACGGPTGGGSPDGPGDPGDVASVRLFDASGVELTFHMPLPAGDTIRVEVRMYAASGRHVTSVTGGEALDFGIPPTRMGSGTAWLPDAAPLPGYHASAGHWTMMVHGNVFLQYDRQFGTRADDQLGSVNWLMAVAERPTAGGTLRFRAMVSAEPWTLTARGYPQLLQVAEPYRGGVVTDRQHPHDAVSEAAVMYEHTVGSRVAGSLYAALVGEPALGPVTYLHRPSAAFDPVTPLGHHSQDVTHTSFGVVTVGVFTRSLRVEASSFNGAHPDEDRTNFDPVRLDSYATRVSWNPGGEWSAAVCL